MHPRRIVGRAYPHQTDLVPQRFQTLGVLDGGVGGPIAPVAEGIQDQGQRQAIMIPHQRSLRCSTVADLGRTRTGRPPDCTHY